MTGSCARHRWGFPQIAVNSGGQIGPLFNYSVFMTRIFALLTALLISISPVASQTYPEYSEVYVNDFAELLSEEEADAIRADLKSLRDDQGIEFTVVTIPLMSDYGHVGAIEPFATGLFNHWGVGDASRNDGVMMLVSRFDREMRIEVGSGYGTSKNDPMKRIIDKVIIPEFKNDRYALGITKGVDAVIYDLTGNWPGEVTFFQKAKGGFWRILDALHVFLVPIVGAIGGFFFWLFKRIRRYKARVCPVDRSKMELLAEHWDDNHLQQGQIAEEELKSVDYDVWECPKCQHRTIEAYRALFTRYGACRSCGFRTVEGETEILEHPTTTSTGLKQIDYTCHHCHDHYSTTKTIPKKSSSSSSGSSSFGGGSSSGGGASGSW